MKLSRIAVLLVATAAVLAPAMPAGAASTLAGWAEAGTIAPMIFEDPFGRVLNSQFIDNPRFALSEFIDNPRSLSSILENPFG
ncbi:hypothetical protein WEI85_16420 [Actinomycetes bacterium KLBMP 9797]